MTFIYTPEPDAAAELRERVTELLDSPDEVIVDALLGFVYHEVARVAGGEMVARWQAEDVIKRVQELRDHWRRRHALDAADELSNALNGPQTPADSPSSPLEGHGT